MLFDKTDKFQVVLLLLSRREVSRSIAHEVNTPQKDLFLETPSSLSPLVRGQGRVSSDTALSPSKINAASLGRRKAGF